MQWAPVLLKGTALEAGEGRVLDVRGGGLGQWSLGEGASKHFKITSFITDVPKYLKATLVACRTVEAGCIR